MTLHIVHTLNISRTIQCTYNPSVLNTCIMHIFLATIGGDEQRIAIARPVLKNTTLLQ